MPVDGHDTATPLVMTLQRATVRPAAAASSCPIRWPIRCSTSGQVGDGGVLFRQGRRLHPDHRRRRAPVHRLPVLCGAQARQGPRPAARRDATRTLMGHAYPMPGLHAKYYDQDFEPLVEVVQDTCGRHDAFALACYAKYYDDIGYPGHVNCSDNFNRRAGRPRRQCPRRLDGGQLLLQHRHRRAWRDVFRRAVVAARRLRAAAGADRHRVRVVRLPRRHHAGQWLGPDRHPCADLFGRAQVLAGDSQTRHSRFRAQDDQRDRLSIRASPSTPATSSNTRATGWPIPSPRKGRSRSTGPAARRRW